MGDNPCQRAMGRAVGGLLSGHGVGRGSCGCPVHGTAPQDGEKGPGPDLALPTGLSALVSGCCLCFSSRDGEGKVSGKPSWDSQGDEKILIPLLRQLGAGSGLLPKTKQKEANEELRETKLKMNKNSPTHLIHRKSCSSVKCEYFAHLNHLLRPFPSQIWRPGLLTQCPSR